MMNSSWFMESEAWSRDGRDFGLHHFAFRNFCEEGK